MADGAAACVCVLFYGSDSYCFDLAQRVLNEPMRQLAKLDIDFRFGLNAVGEQTKQFVRRQASLFFKNATVLESQQNLLKYPTMRRLLHARDVVAPFVIWFDDDSCLAPSIDVENWFSRLSAQMQACDVAGSVRRARLPDEQRQWVRGQRWYCGKNFLPYVSFVSGGWWAARTSLFYEFDWPPPELRQKGGDVALGELCRQQELAVAHFRDGVWISANADGIEAAAPRRQYDSSHRTQAIL